MTKEILKMTLKKAERLGVIESLIKKDLTLQQASKKLGLCVKQTRRVRKRYLEESIKGLVSRKRGQPSSRKISEEVRSRVMKIVKEKYCDFGPTLATEKLKERNKIILSVETLRKWMIEEEIWKDKKKKEKRIYQRRARRRRFFISITEKQACQAEKTLSSS